MNAAKPKVLVVDDEPEILALLTRALSSEAEVIAAPDAFTAMHLLGESDDIAAVISDFDMPGLNGLELFAELQDFCPQIPRILISNRNDLQPQAAAATVEVFAYLVKPFERHVLQDTVQRAIAAYRG
ncbi:MAG: response regulator [Pseudanabaenaceae cyanobacterium]